MTKKEAKVMRLLFDACAEFVRKCDDDEARSTRSYAQMKEAIHAYLELTK